LLGSVESLAPVGADLDDPNVPIIVAKNRLGSDRNLTETDMK
jgi:hypothetical protein